MRTVFIAPAAILAATLILAPAALAEDNAIDKCKKFFAAFEKCADGLKGDQQDAARVTIKTMRGMIGMSDDLNQGDALVTGMMCAGMMDEMKKDSDVKSYNCQW